MRLRKQEGDTKTAAILKLHKEQPELDSLFLAERFNCTQSHVCNVLSKRGHGRFECPHCKRIFNWKYKFNNHMAIRKLKGACPKTNKYRANEKRPCPHCGKKLSPAGLGAHLKTRERMGHCPGKKPKVKPKPKSKSPRPTKYQRDHLRVSQGRWSHLEDVEDMG